MNGMNNSFLIMKHETGMEGERRSACLSTQIFAKQLLKRNVQGLTVKKKINVLPLGR